MAGRPSGLEPGRPLIGGRSPADTRPIASPQPLRTIASVPSSVAEGRTVHGLGTAAHHHN
jgi:hypothetical protein